MQLFLSLSKYLLFVLLSCSLLLVWNYTNVDVSGLVSMSASPTITYVDESAFVRPTTTPIVRAEPKPIDSIWASMSHEFTLDHWAESAKVRAEIRKLLADQHKLYHILTAAAPYIYFIHQQTQVRGLPAELALIPVIESEFNPNDHSTKGATGLWQLMPGTAHELGVKVRSGYDGRRNVIASTTAALAYFKDLGVMFKGNWLLAIAAYNCGQMKVVSATRRANTHNFWNLHLPKETEYYVPKLLAVVAIIKNPEKYGVKLPAVTNEPYFTQMKVKKSINLTQIAKSSGSTIKVLHTLNPDYKSEIIVPQKGNTILLIPIPKVNKLLV
jgi:membrane-bound lytic murein transglycosylase D